MRLPFSHIDDIRLDALIHESPYTLVVIGYQARLERRVLVKLLKPHTRHQEEMIRRFQKEARVCANLRHPHIVSVHDLGEEGEYHYIVQEFVDGINLRELVREAGPLDPHRVRAILDDVLDALAHAHEQGVIHRDIKPANILVDRSGRVKVADFGLARIRHGPEMTHQDALVGSPAYMSPEQITGETMDGRSDLFAVGCTAYELLTGRQAFPGDDVPTCLHKVLNDDPEPLALARPGLPEEWTAFLNRLMAKRADDRPGDAAAARRLLPAAESTGEPLAALVARHAPAERETTAVAAPNGPGGTSRPSPASRRTPAWSLALVGASLLLAVLLYGLWIGRDTDKVGGRGPLNEAGLAGGTPADGGDAAPADSSIAGAEMPTARGEERGPISGSADEGGTSAAEPVPSPQLDTGSPTDGSGDPPNAAALPPEGGGDIATEGGDRGTVEAPAAPATGTIVVTVEPWARVLVDSQAVLEQADRGELSVPAGTHQVTLLHPSYPPHVATVAVGAGERVVLGWSFPASMGYLWLEVFPWADVWVDDQYRDTTPLSRPLMVPPGRHVIELRHPQLPSRREVVTVAAGDTLSRQIRLDD